jgi:hypothetical protein
MRVLLFSFLMFFALGAGCARNPPPPPDPLVLPAGLPDACKTTARLPRPPPAPRSIPDLTRWAGTAALVANAAIAERDRCAMAYQQLMQAVVAAIAARQ